MAFDGYFAPSEYTGDPSDFSVKQQQMLEEAMDFGLLIDNVPMEKLEALYALMKKSGGPDSALSPDAVYQLITSELEKAKVRERQDNDGQST